MEEVDGAGAEVAVAVAVDVEFKVDEVPAGVVVITSEAIGFIAAKRVKRGHKEYIYIAHTKHQQTRIFIFHNKNKFQNCTSLLSGGLLRASASQCLKLNNAAQSQQTLTYYTYIPFRTCIHISADGRRASSSRTFTCKQKHMHTHTTLAIMCIKLYAPFSTCQPGFVAVVYS